MGVSQGSGYLSCVQAFQQLLNTSAIFGERIATGGSPPQEEPVKPPSFAFSAARAQAHGLDSTNHADSEASNQRKMVQRKIHFSPRQCGGRTGLHP